MLILNHLTGREGVCRTGELIRLGVTSRQVADLVARGLIVRLRQGVLALDPDAPTAIAAVHGGQLACVSAARARGVWILTSDDRVHVGMTRDHHAHPHPDCRCVQHQDRYSRGFGAVSLRVALVQIAACCGSETFFAAFESALNKGLLKITDREWIRQQLPARMKFLVDIARTDAESGLESILRLRLLFLGIAVQPQVVIAGVGRVDFVIGNVIIEVDGRLNHDGYSMRHKDLVRDATATQLGYRVLRFDYAMVIHDWPAVVAAIRAAVTN